MHLLIQEVLVLWTKASREEPLSSQRQSLPSGFVLPVRQLASASLFKHRIAFIETSGFALPEESYEELPLADSMQQGCVRAQRNSESAWQITYQHTLECGGLPPRDGVVQEKSLTLGAWGRVRYQGRVSDRDPVQWLYYARTMNIGWVTRLERALFVDTAPVWVIEDEQHFF